jgi:hypothetical protein
MRKSHSDRRTDPDLAAALHKLALDLQEIVVRIVANADSLPPGKTLEMNPFLEELRVHDAKTFALLQAHTPAEKIASLRRKFDRGNRNGQTWEEYLQEALLRIHHLPLLNLDRMYAP